MLFYIHYITVLYMFPNVVITGWRTKSKRDQQSSCEKLGNTFLLHRIHIVWSMMQTEN